MMAHDFEPEDSGTAFEVYDEDENVIPGLYACGEVVGGVHGDFALGCVRSG